MDNRTALYYGSTLEYESLRITVESEIGRGSNSLIYLGSYPDPITSGEKHTVLIKELFPLHPEGAIYRDADNRVVCKPEGEELFETHKQSFLAGNEIHLKMLSECPGAIASNIISFNKNNTVYTLMDYTAGRSLEAEMIGPEYDLRRLAVRMLRLLRALEVFHSCGYLHLDISAENTLLIGQGDDERVILIDYNSAWKMGGLMRGVFPTSSQKKGHTAPEVRTNRLRLLCPASDLYSVTAMFYRCISDSILTPVQMTSKRPPDISQCPCIENQPATVVYQVCRILVKGLEAAPTNRYASCGEMAEDFRELIDRIDGKGISHWALWEAGQKTITRMLKENAALSYLESMDALYPLNASDGSGEIKPVREWIRNAISKSGGHLMLTAPGGMGKTTAVLEYIIENGRKFTSASPAFIYIPLKRFCEGNKTFVTDSILENLRFKNDVTTFETARHALKELLSRGICYRNAVLPAAVVFLDGLNEIRDGHQELFDEIAQLSQLQGIKIIITSRTYEPVEGFEELKITPMSEQTVQKQLSFNGLLMPQDKAMAELLKTPLMLSVFIQASKAEGRQLSIKSEDELMQVYFSSLLAKEINSLSQDNDLRWQLEAAVELVLPILAERMRNKGRALSDAELLETANNCYDIFSSRLFSRTFKQWIGHSKAILGEAKSGEEWYGIMVHSLLWQRLGLLVRDENGCYSVPHQILEEYLAQNGQAINRKLRRRKQVKALILSAVFALFFALGIIVYSTYFSPEPLKPYDDDSMTRILSDAVSRYTWEGRRYEALCELIDSADSAESFDESNARYKKTKNRNTGILSAKQRGKALEVLTESGEVCSWSGEPFDVLDYSAMCELYGERDDCYEHLIDLLDSVLHDRHLYNLYYENFIEQFQNYIELDADISSAYYLKVCMPHLTDSYVRETIDGDTLNKMLGDNSIRKQREHEQGIKFEPEKFLQYISGIISYRDGLLTSAQIDTVQEAIEIEKNINN